MHPSSVRCPPCSQRPPSESTERDVAVRPHPVVPLSPRPLGGPTVLRREGGTVTDEVHAGRTRARPKRAGLRRGARAALLSSALLAGAAGGVVALSPPAAAYSSPKVSLVGHGYGHGHGMGQWGALGYALAQTGYQSIVGHYYGGTTLVGLPSGADANQPVKVALTENNGNSVIVTSASAFTVSGIIVPAGSALLMAPVPGQQWNLFESANCAGGPTGWGPMLATITNPTATLTDPGGTLQLCQNPTNLTVHGSIGATYTTDCLLYTSDAADE